MSKRWKKGEGKKVGNSNSVSTCRHGKLWTEPCKECRPPDAPWNDKVDDLFDSAYGSQAKSLKDKATDWVKGKAEPQKNTSWERCYHKHPALPLKDGLVIYGGSCTSPAVHDADIYIGFDAGMKFTDRVFPWTEGWEILYRIQDRGVPTKPENFKKLVEWTIEQLKAGQKVHAGCIGGHGRTGMFFSALVATLMPEVEDAIGYVRKNYCHEVVESPEQVAFLVKEFGVKRVEGSDGGGKKGGKTSVVEFTSSSGVTYSGTGSYKAGTSAESYVKGWGQPKANTPSGAPTWTSGEPFKTSGCIFGKEVEIVNKTS